MLTRSITTEIFIRLKIKPGSFRPHFIGRNWRTGRDCARQSDRQHGQRHPCKQRYFLHRQHFEKSQRSRWNCPGDLNLCSPRLFSIHNSSRVPQSIFKAGWDANWPARYLHGKEGIRGHRLLTYPLFKYHPVVKSLGYKSIGNCKILWELALQICH